MVVQRSINLDGVFHALADPTRRAMLVSLVASQRTVGELAAPFDMSLAAASKHIKVLEKAGLVRRRVEGRIHICRIETAALAAASEWMRFYEALWNEQFDVLDAMFKAENEALTHPHQEEIPHAHDQIDQRDG